MRILTLLLLLPYIGFCQQTSLKSTEIEGTLTATDSIQKEIRTATWLSVALPGAGQVYNKKYWKVPLVYAGLGTSLYFVRENIRNLNEFKTLLIAEEDNDPLTVNDSGYSVSQLNDIVDTYYQWRDLSWMSVGVVYILNIIDAHVDAHLNHFDVGDNLSLQLSPFLQPRIQQVAGLTLTLNF